VQTREIKGIVSPLPLLVTIIFTKMDLVNL
jgi:hypothetical protein